MKYFIIYLYCAFAYGYGLSLMGEIYEELCHDYQYNTREFVPALLFNLVMYLFFPLILIFITLSNWYYSIKDLVKR